tara:strand:+ start:487 stop:1308 length:822 start_codon:yes stop_codon:yes gene_type:complete
MKKLNGWWVDDDCNDDGIKNWDADSWQNHFVQFSVDTFVEKRPIDIVLDIGANIGQSALGWAKHCNKVISFEPHPIMFECLEKNVEESGYDNIELHNIGLSNKTEILTFKRHLHKDGISRFMYPSEQKRLVENDKMIPKSSSSELPVTTLDKHFIDNPIESDRITVIKIDVESWELKTLVGARKTIIKYHPLLIVEISKQRSIESESDTYENTIEFLKKQMNYVLIFKRRSDHYFAHRNDVKPIFDKHFKTTKWATDPKYWKNVEFEWKPEET